MSKHDPDRPESTATIPGGVAVIGIGCRFPGATCLDEFWKVLSNGENHITEVPQERWLAEDFYDSDPHAVGKNYTNKAGLIKDFAHFDHKLFGINETEASQMDVQQRQVLECTYMALENAGITRKKISGQKVGVYIGQMNSDYNMRTMCYPELLDQYSVAGIASSVIANRVSYLFNLTGPSMAIDTACSSSIVAIHQAILGLRAGDCTLAICGGVSLILHPQVFTPLCKAQMLSKTGQCHTFSNDADGYTRGEGCGVVILKLAEKASSDNDYIWGTIVTGLNQDGHFAQPITAPSEKQQEELLEHVFTTYNIDSGTVQYIEAHGTGTRRGDPVEVGAFASFFSKSGQQRQRYIGSVKTNIGHLEPAAGVAGLIKVLLMMKHNTIVPSVNFDKPNELIDLDRCQFVVPTTCYPWADESKVACLNSFGFGGANSHAVIRSVTRKSKDTQVKRQQYWIVCFSGSTFNGLCSSMLDFLTLFDDADIWSVAYTSTVCREHFRFRKSWVVETVENLKHQIEKFTSDHQKKDIDLGPKSGIVFVFSGMGTAWLGMCREYMETYIIFNESIHLIDKSLRRFVSWSLTERFKASYDVNHPLFGPIATFACQVALGRLWESLGVIPEAVLGQSVGEVAAAHIAGILPLDEAVKVIYNRTYIMSQATGGKMLMVRNIETKQIVKLCSNRNCRANIALYYSPVSCTISGDAEDVEAINDEILKTKSDIPNVQLLSLNVTSAFHSPHMDPCQEKLDLALQGLKSKTPAIRMISTVDPEYGESDLISAGYWGKNVRHPVQFHDAILTATKGERKIFVEIGPKPVLRAHLKDIFSTDNQSISVSSMSENKGDLLTALSVLYDNKVNIEWENLFEGHTLPLPFPRYAFNQTQFWKLGVLTKEEIYGSKSGPSDHLFLTRLDSPFKCKLSLKPTEFATVYEHKIKDIIVVPGATYAEAGFGLVNILAMGNPHTSVISVRFASPVTLQQGNQTDLDIDVLRKSSHEATFKICKDDRVHATGTILSSKELYGEDRIDLGTIRERCQQQVSGRDLYQLLEHSGFTYGENFATIDCAFRGEGESLAALKISPKLQREMNHTLLHPAVLDAMLQAPIITYFHNDEFLPVELSEVTLRRPLQKEMFAYSKLTMLSGLQTNFYLCLFDADGTILAQVRKFSTKITKRQGFDGKSATYLKTWMEVPFGQPVRKEERTTTIFTNVQLDELDLPMALYDFDLVTSERIEQFEPTLRDTSQICFIYKISDISVSGDDLLKELIKRINPLRLLLLYNSHRHLKIPFYVIMEARKSSNSKGIEAATSCLNEAINGFCRCALREFKTLQLKTVEIHTADRNEFVTRLPTLIDSLSSEDMKYVPEIRIQDDVAQMFELQMSMVDTPSYRTTPLLDASVLCSKIQNTVVKPSFFLARDSNHKTRKNEAEIRVLTAVIHNPLLYMVTAHEHPHFGTSEAQTYPILSLEFSGKLKLKSKEHDVITCYPAKLQKTITVPTNCTLSKAIFPQYESGYLLILYTLWCMASVSDLKSVAILYVTDTKPLATVLAILLRSKHVKSLSLLTQDDTLESTNHELLISTVMPTENIVEVLCEKSRHLKNIVFLGSIISQQIIRSFTWCPWMKVTVLHPLEMFSPAVISKNVPKMFQWMHCHCKEMEEIVPHLKHSRSKKILKNVRPINLTEILQTTELFLNDKEEVGLNYMETPNTHLIKKARSYMVVGGLTGLGWECVSYLATKGAGCVIILNRRNPDDERQKEIVHLEKAHGCVVKTYQTDVTNFKQLEATFFSLRGEFARKPLAGVFFGAAILQDASLLELTMDKLKSSLSPKVSGAWNLHILTADLPLDFLVFHSSTASILGNPGQSNYGAGNGFMDELAHCRRRCGLSGQSFNWGPLGLGMLQNKPSVIKRLQKQGFETFEKKEISQCLTHLLMLNEPQSILMKIDKRKLAEQLLQSDEKLVQMRLQSVLAPFMKGLQDTDKVNTKTYLNIEKLKKSNEQEALHMLQLYLKHLACDKALLDEDTFDMTVEMKLQGVDSMYAMEISGKVMSDLGINLSAQEIQLQSTLNLAQQLTDKLFSKESVCTMGTNDEHIVSKSSILKSIAESFSWSNKQDDAMTAVLVCTMKLPELADANFIKKILKICISMHRLARSTCDLGKSFAIRELTVDEAFDLRLATTSEVERMKTEPINLECQGPLRFIFVTETKQLILIFHKFFFDLRAVTIFVNDILRLSVDNGSSFHNSDNEEYIDVAEEIQKVVARNFREMYEFWKSRLTHIPYHSFHQGFHVQNISQGPIVITKRMNNDFYRRVTDFIQEQKISFFQYFASIYQLSLCFVNNTLSSAITTSFDTRLNVPTLAKSLGRCTNLVPLICQLTDVLATVAEFMERNQSDIEKCLRNGIFPYEEMKKLANENIIHHLRKNHFIHEDDSLTSEQNELNVEQAVAFLPQTETWMFVWQKRQTDTIEIKCHLNGNIYSTSGAEAFVDAFIYLLTETMNDPDISMNYLNEKLQIVMKTGFPDKTKKKDQVRSSLCLLM